MKKPSEWTPQEAHERLRRMIADYLEWKGCVSLSHTVRAGERFDFPADPVERVSDRELKTCGNGYALPTELQRLMALELIERRAKDKEQGR